MKKSEIYLAGGCFWGVEAYFKALKGVLETEVGYANGQSEETCYEELRNTGHAETLKLIYDANRVHLAEILDRFYTVIDPTSLNRQGGDFGTQYRTGIFYTDDKSLEIAKLSLGILNDSLGGKVQIIIEKLKHFIPAEEYHQDYLDKNPNGYCHINVSKINDILYPPLFELTDAEIEKTYGVEARRIVKEKATERPYSSKYDKFFEEGIYADIVSGQPLFSSADKFDSGCGWPSFSKGITTDVINYRDDFSISGRPRVEVISKESDSHLGHVFEDGLKEMGGLRYCINGLALKFIPKEQMENSEFKKLLPYLIKQ